MKVCRKCNQELVIRPSKKSPNQLLKQYYYSAYYFCPQCQRIYLDDKFKIVNKNFTLFNKPKLENIEVEIWTDGACSNNGRPNAKAAWAFVSLDHEEAGLVEGKQTNNTGEGYAILFALKWAAKQGFIRIKIYSDSQISLNNLTKAAGMVKENREIFLAIESLIKTKSLDVEYEKVPAHADNAGNNRADRLANDLVGIK